MIAVGQQDRFPLDVNTASESDLLRVPGVGPTAARRIIRQRREHSVTRRQELQAMGVVLKRALPFLRFPGHKPEPTHQGVLPLFDTSPSLDGPQAAALHAKYASRGC